MVCTTDATHVQDTMCVVRGRRKKRNVEEEKGSLTAIRRNASRGPTRASPL